MQQDLHPSLSLSQQTLIAATGFAMTPKTLWDCSVSKLNHNHYNFLKFIGGH